MVVPSAALPGTHNLMLFGVRLLQPYLWAPPTDDEIATGHLTDGARPTAEVVAHVRWRGTAHTAAEQWKAPGSYEPFADPVAAR